MRDKLVNVLWGLFFIVIGVGIAGKVLNLWEFSLFFKGWWTLLIIVPCFISMIKGNFGVGSTMGFIIGILLLVAYRVDLDFNVWKMIVPVMLIYIGLRFIFQSAFRKTIRHDSNVHVEGHNTTYTEANKNEQSAVFSSNRIHVNDQFTGTRLNAVFGSITLDLRDAIISSDVEINATAIFAGIDIYIPSGVRLKINNVPIFGGVSNKTMPSNDPAAPIIYLNSTCMFGGIDIK